MYYVRHTTNFKEKRTHKPFLYVHSLYFYVFSLVLGQNHPFLGVFPPKNRLLTDFTLNPPQSIVHCKTPRNYGHLCACLQLFAPLSLIWKAFCCFSLGFAYFFDTQTAIQLDTLVFRVFQHLIQHKHPYNQPYYRHHNATRHIGERAVPQTG